MNRRRLIRYYTRKAEDLSNELIKEMAVGVDGSPLPVEQQTPAWQKKREKWLAAVKKRNGM